MVINFLNKPITQELDLDQSIKIIGINIKELQNKLKIGDVTNVKDLESQLSQMAFTLSDLQNKKAKNDVRLGTNRKYPSLYDPRPQTKEEKEELYRLIG